MSFNIEVRKKQLHSLNQYINSTKDKVESILNYLGWTGKTVLETPDKIKCPIDQKHRIPIEKIDKHVQKCSLISSGYDNQESFLSEPRGSSSSSVKLDLARKIEILNEARQLNPKFKPAWNGIDSDPMTSDRYFSTFSTDERLAMYDYCVRTTEGPPVPNELTLNLDEPNKKGDTTLTEKEQLTKERNAKRRPVKYKTVHTGRSKSDIEVTREVIQNQMDMYRDFLIEKEKAEKEAERKRQQELIEKAQAYEQFPHIDTNVVYDYGIDPFEIPESSNLENCCNGNISYNVNYDYEADLPPRVEKDCIEVVRDLNNHEEEHTLEKRDVYKYRPTSKTSYRDRDRSQKNRDREYKRRSERKSRERREYYPRRSREDRREPYLRSERRH